MFKRLMTTFIMFLFIAGCSSSYLLQYKGSPGKIRRYQMDTNLEQNMEMMGNEINITMQLVSFITQTIENIEDSGNINISIVYDSLQFDATGMQMVAMKGKLEEQINKLKGKKIEFRISNKGEVLETSGIDSLLPQQLNQFVNSRELASSFTPDLPDKKVKIGDSWEVKKEVPIEKEDAKMKMNVSRNSKLTLIGKEKVDGLTLLKIQHTGTVGLDGEMEQGGMNLFLEGDGDIKGEILFDVKNGCLYSHSSETEMDLTIATSGQQNMTIPMMQYVKVKISRLK